MLASIRALELEFNPPIGVLQDLQGPKIRISRLDEAKLALDARETVRFALSERKAGSSQSRLPHPEIFAAAYPDAPYTREGAERCIKAYWEVVASRSGDASLVGEAVGRAKRLIMRRHQVTGRV
ncbi:hypothetical protein N2603_39825 [Bradyrhizobium huanghuaihaiense]|uniref:hypothetical protein n=1 Tax=Bradyrhizobium huanghuaihaiense TaxID=990078 RepID=UPI0021A9CECE|nr:hypothetical protein [Bradyrhizobium sp. CB3035]UWU76010.1 hypothetical protein N2603_39825 [Bradyrhizobium sp. CB3035]